MVEFYFSHQIGFALFGVAALILSVALAVVSFRTMRRAKRLEDRLEALFGGKKATDLEKLITDQAKALKGFDKEIQELYNISNTVNTRSQRGLHKIGITRFNASADIGGEQSFVVALLDGANSGVVISSLHTHSGTQFHVKPVVKGKEFGRELTEEEIKAVRTAHPQKRVKNV